MALMRLSRRRFLGTSVAAGAGLLAPAGLEMLLARIAHGATPAIGYGPLIPDPRGMLDLPKGFEYRMFSTAMLGEPNHARFGQKLSAGDPVPPLHDGMAAFAGKHGITILVRNHEIDLRDEPGVDPGRIRPYDKLARGGTTTLWVDAERNLVKSFASLSGTVRNCAGGPTPWGTWLTCEECTYMPGEKDPKNHDRTPLVSKRHGYVFEVDAHATALVEPQPIQAMGRFYHEAVAVDPETATVYLSEDRDDGLLYRFRPDAIAVGTRNPFEMRAGDLGKGGVLEALRVIDLPSARTQNWDPAATFKLGARFKVNWVRIPVTDPDMDMERDPDDPELDPLERKARTAATSTRAQGFALGAAQFARGEGMLHDRGMIYLCCTNGGREKAGQVWKLDLLRMELALAVEPNDKNLLEAPDNLCMAPNDDLIMCEDHRGRDRIIGITSKGGAYVFANNAFNDTEFAGACFAPDGRTLFVNSQNPGITFAIWGPWARRRG